VAAAARFELGWSRAVVAVALVGITLAVVLLLSGR
jgi:hypothetical protein